MPNTIIGTVLEIGNTEVVPTRSGNEFCKRQLVLDASTYDQFTGERRENLPSFNFLQKHVGDLDHLQVGERVIVSFAISGRRYEKDGVTRYFNDIVGFKVEPFTNGSQPYPSSVPYQQPAQTLNAAQSVSNAAQSVSNAAQTGSPQHPFPPQVNAYGEEAKHDLPF